MKTVYTKVQHFPGGKVPIGIVFATRADAVAYSDAFHTNPYSYRIPGESEDVNLRVILPRSPAVKRKGVNQQFYECIDTGGFRGKLRTNYP